MAENSRFRLFYAINFCANRGNCCIFFTTQKERAAGIADGPFRTGTKASGSAESGYPLGESRKLPRRRILVQNAASNTASHLRLRLAKRFGSLILLAGGQRRLDGLDEGPDTADAAVIDGGAPIVPADALLGLWRVRHECPSKTLWFNEKAAQSQEAAPARASH
jgi:hypothetical protein